LKRKKLGQEKVWEVAMPV